MLEQWREAAFSSETEWILITDSDAELEFYPISFHSYSEFVSFRWIDAPEIFGKKHFGIGMYRVSALRRVFEKYETLTSEGLDLVLAHELETEFSLKFTYMHNAKLTFRRFFRYGKGRAFFGRICKPDNFLPQERVFKLKYLKFYFAWGLGFLYGLCAPLRDNHW